METWECDNTPPHIALENTKTILEKLWVVACDYSGVVYNWRERREGSGIGENFYLPVSDMYHQALLSCLNVRAWEQAKPCHNIYQAGILWHFPVDCTRLVTASNATEVDLLYIHCYHGAWIMLS